MAHSKIIISCLSFVILSVLISNIAIAGLSTSPATVNFKSILRGGYAEQYFVIRNIDVQSVQISMGPEGGVADWLNVVGESKFLLGPDESRMVKVSFTPPLDAPNGDYRTTLYITSVPVSAAFQSGVILTWGIDIPVSLQVTDIEVANYTVEAFSVSNAEECKVIQFGVNAYNRGNVRVNPTYRATIMNINRTAVIKEHDYRGDDLLPTQLRTDTIRIPYELGQFRCIPQGEYILKMEAYLNDQVIYTDSRLFEILEPGALTILGNLKGIDYPKEVEVGQVVKIDGKFINVGEEALVSKMRCEIYGDNSTKLFSVVESDQMEVAVGKEEILTAFYTPLGPGEQLISCVVNYENKVTPPVKGPLTVSIPLMWIYALILLLIIIIIIIVWKMTRRRNVQ